MRLIATAIACLCSTICWAQPAQLTSDQQAAVAQLLNLPPGSSVTLERTQTHDGGTMEVEEEATGQGASLKARGEKIVSDFNSTAPGAALGGGRQATGGDSDISSKIIGGTNLRANPCLWAGILCILGAGVGLYLRMPVRAVIIAGAVGVGLILMVLMPALIFIVVAAVILLVVGPYIHREWAHMREQIEHKKDEQAASANREALRAVVAGVGDFGKAAKDTTNPGVAPEAYEKLKSFIQSHALPEDDALIRQIKEQDRV